MFFGGNESIRLYSSPLNGKGREAGLLLDCVRLEVSYKLDSEIRSFFFTQLFFKSESCSNLYNRNLS